MGTLRVTEAQKYSWVEHRRKKTIVNPYRQNQEGNRRMQEHCRNEKGWDYEWCSVSVKGMGLIWGYPRAMKYQERGRT